MVNNRIGKRRQFHRPIQPETTQRTPVTRVVPAVSTAGRVLEKKIAALISRSESLEFGKRIRLSFRIEVSKTATIRHDRTNGCDPINRFG